MHENDKCYLEWKVADKIAVSVLKDIQKDIDKKLDGLYTSEPRPFIGDDIARSTKLLTALEIVLYYFGE